MRKLGTMWPTLKRLLAYGSPWRKPLSVAVLLLWIAAIAEVSGPLLISYFIDNMVAKSYLPLGLVAGLGVAYVGLQLTAAGLHYAQSLLFNRAAVGVVQQLRTDVMDAALRQPLSEFDIQPVGQVISRVTNDTEVIPRSRTSPWWRRCPQRGADWCDAGGNVQSRLAHGAGGDHDLPGGADRHGHLPALQHANRASCTSLSGRHQRWLQRSHQRHERYPAVPPAGALW